MSKHRIRRRISCYTGCSDMRAPNADVGIYSVSIVAGGARAQIVLLPFVFPLATCPQGMNGFLMRTIIYLSIAAGNYETFLPLGRTRIHLSEVFEFDGNTCCGTIAILRTAALRRYIIRPAAASIFLRLRLHNEPLYRPVWCNKQLIGWWGGGNLF